jgi:(p)ppGpp synthase/HD superfamily hydrolase
MAFMSAFRPHATMRRMILTTRFGDAVVYAAAAHAGQVRKGTGIPYVSHVLEVAALVIAHGGDEDQAITGLLHDVPEDTGGRASLDDIRRRFGDAVADMVDGCTDTYETPKPPWRPRKEAYISRLPTLSAATRLVSAADKVTNLRAIVDDYRVIGDALWARFAGGSDTIWYYRTIARVFRATERTGLTDKLDRLVDQLLAVAQRP